MENNSTMMLKERFRHLVLARVADGP